MGNRSCDTEWMCIKANPSVIRGAYIYSNTLIVQHPNLSSKLFSTAIHFVILGGLWCKAPGSAGTPYCEAPEASSRLYQVWDPFLRMAYGSDQKLQLQTRSCFQVTGHSEAREGQQSGLASNNPPIIELICWACLRLFYYELWSDYECR